METMPANHSEGEKMNNYEKMTLLYNRMLELQDRARNGGSGRIKWMIDVTGLKDYPNDMSFEMMKGPWDTTDVYVWISEPADRSPHLLPIRMKIANLLWKQVKEK
jgi:hypothetical protein